MTVHGRRIVTIFILPLVLVLSSCVKVEYEAKISSVDKIELSISLGFTKSLVNQGLQVGSPKELCGLLPTVGGAAQPSEFDDGTYAGCKLSGIFKLGELDGQGITYDKATEIWTFQLDGRSVSGQPVSADMISALNISVTFPGRVLESSGKAVVSGTTVTWSDASDLISAEGIRARASNTGAPISWYTILFGVLGLGVGGAAIYFILVMRGKGAGRQDLSGPSPGEPAGPGSGGPFAQQPGYQTGSLQAPGGHPSHGSGFQPGPAQPSYQPTSGPSDHQGWVSDQSWRPAAGTESGGLTSPHSAGSDRMTPDSPPPSGPQFQSPDTPQPPRYLPPEVHRN